MGGDCILEEVACSPVSRPSTHACKSLSSTGPDRPRHFTLRWLHSEATYLRARGLFPQNPFRLPLRDLLDHYSRLGSRKLRICLSA